jgi:uncharacterized protein with GYD domain
MPNYVILMKLTDQGSKIIKEAPGRINAGIKALEKMGGKVTGFYVVMGEYDYVAVGEAPSDEVATIFALATWHAWKCQDDDAQGVHEGRVCRDAEEVALAVIARNNYLHFVAKLDAGAPPTDQKCRVSD